MKKIAAIIWKDTALRFSTPAEWLFFLILPIIFTFLLAGGAPSGEDDPRIRLTVVDLAGTPLSSELIKALEASASVQPVQLSLAEAEKRFDQRQVSAMLIIPAGFDLEQLKAGTAALEYRQQPNNLNAQAAERAVQTAIQRTGSAVQIALNAVQQAESVQPFASPAERQAYFDQSLSPGPRNHGPGPQPGRNHVRPKTKNPVHYDPARQRLGRAAPHLGFHSASGAFGRFCLRAPAGHAAPPADHPHRKSHLPAGDHPRAGADRPGPDQPAGRLRGPGTQDQLGPRPGWAWR